MKPVVNFLKTKWRRRKHKGVSGNFSTVVILSLIMAGSFVMTGGGFPEPVPSYENGWIEAEPLPKQPNHAPVGSISFREYRFEQRPTPAPDAPPEDPVTSCQQSSVAFLVDVSGSMLKPSTNGMRKIDVLRNAIIRFTTAMPDEALVGIYSFSEPFDGVISDDPREQGSIEPSVPEPRERLALTPLSESRSMLQQVVSQLEPYPFAATYMRDGLAGADAWLRASKITYPEHTQTLIFISDGIPETDVRGPNDIIISETSAYSPDQDPTKEPNLGSRIKANGVRIYSVAVYSQEDTVFLPQLRSILTNIASQPSEPHYIDSLNADDIESKFTQIQNQICPPV